MAQRVMLSKAEGSAVVFRDFHQNYTQKASHFRIANDPSICIHIPPYVAFCSGRMRYRAMVHGGRFGRRILYKSDGSPWCDACAH
jgi:hypothetical protein